MGTIASQITSLTIVYSTVYSGADQSKHQSSASLAFVWGIHRGPVNSPHKWPVTRKMFPFDDVIVYTYTWSPRDRSSKATEQLRPQWSRFFQCLTHLGLSYTSVHPETKSSLVQINVCHLFGDKPLSEPILVYYQLNPWEYTSMKTELKCYNAYSKKNIWKCRLQNDDHIVSVSTWWFYILWTSSQWAFNTLWIFQIMPIGKGPWQMECTGFLTQINSQEFSSLFWVVDDNVNGDENVTGDAGADDSCQLHDDVIKWKHFPRYWPLCGEFFDLRLNKCWVNNGDAGDSRRHLAHYDATVMLTQGCQALHVWKISNSVNCSRKLTLWPLGDTACTLTPFPLDKMAAISQTTYSNAVSLMKSFVFWFKFHWSLFIRVTVSIGSGNGLAPNRRQVINWTNADPVHWRIYTALGGDELS